MRVLVTGGTGYLGAAIVRALRRAGHEPVVFARRARAANPDVPASIVADVPAINGDVRDPGAVFEAARGMDAICHTAALVSVWRPRPADFDAVNVGGLQAVLDACAAHRIPKLIYTASFLALPPAGASQPLEANDYQRTKVAALRLAREAGRQGAPIVSLFPGVIYGPGPLTEGNLIGRLIADHLAGRLPGLIGADRRWSYAHVDDVADAHAAALERGSPGDEYPLGGENVPQMRVFEVVRSLTGRALPRRIPFLGAEAAALIEELRARVTGRPPLLTRGVVSIFRHEWTMDSARSVARLGYAIRPLEEGLRGMIADVSR